MQFLLFDVGATLVFLAAYLAAANLRRRRASGALAPRRQPVRLASPR
ncbi:MAG TPA: hypothetical protein VGR80_10175 [Steroidobacteraceae bacterium]|nr:hypothetical protein [Steroidobacteraceae bacterium]